MLYFDYKKEKAMNRENTAIRLKTIMNIRGLRQVDILNLTIPYCKKYDVKMNKSDISQYCSGKTEPNQEKLFILGNALNVNEAWLMGFDVPMERVSNKKEATAPDPLPSDQQQLNDIYSRLDRPNKKKVLTYSKNLLSTQQMEEALVPNAAHAFNPTEEEKKHADDIMMDDKEWE